MHGGWYSNDLHLYWLRHLVVGRISESFPLFLIFPLHHNNVGFFFLFVFGKKHLIALYIYMKKILHLLPLTTVLYLCT